MTLNWIFDPFSGLLSQILNPPPWVYQQWYSVCTTLLSFSCNLVWLKLNIRKWTPKKQVLNIPGCRHWECKTGLVAIDYWVIPLYDLPFEVHACMNWQCCHSKSGHYSHNPIAANRGKNWPDQLRESEGNVPCLAVTMSTSKIWCTPAINPQNKITKFLHYKPYSRILHQHQRGKNTLTLSHVKGQLSTVQIHRFL